MGCLKIRGVDKDVDKLDNTFDTCRFYINCRLHKLNKHFCDIYPIFFLFFLPIHFSLMFVLLIIHLFVCLIAICLLVSCLTCIQKLSQQCLCLFVNYFAPKDRLSFFFLSIVVQSKLILGAVQASPV